MKERSCKRAKGLFSNHFDQDLTGPDADWLEGHLRNCPSCRKEFASYRSLFQSVRKLPAVQASSGFETRLYARMREEHASPARASWWQELSRVPLHVPIGAAALILLAVFAFTRTGPERPGAPLPSASSERIAETTPTRENTRPTFLEGASPTGGPGVAVVSGDGGRSVQKPALGGRDRYDLNGRLLMGPFPPLYEERPASGTAPRRAQPVDTLQAR